MGLPFDPRVAPDVLRERAVIGTEFIQRSIQILGSRQEGTDWQIRFRAPYGVPWVQVHVQSTVAGQGGLSYAPANFLSSTKVDCRTSRVQDMTIGSLASAERYAVFLIPIQEDGAGTEILFDGEAGRPDDMSFLTEPRALTPAPHALVSAFHTAAGLTVGQVVRATGATTFAWQRLTAADVDPGTFPSGSYTIPGALILESVTSPQFTVRYDGSNLFTLSVASNGLVTLDAGGVGAGFLVLEKITLSGLLQAQGKAVIGLSDPGGAEQLRVNGDVRIAGKITQGDATALLHTTTALNDGAGAAAGTLGNAPSAGNPTKWLPVDDNGTTRYVPSWT